MSGKVFKAFEHKTVSPSPLVLLILTVAGFLTRFYILNNPGQVVFDEVHFGGFASKYLNQEFFMDVHPPLGKLLIAGSGAVLGFNGTFTFKEIGLDFGDVPYVGMRAVPAMFGALLPSLGYLTMLNFGFSQAGGVLVGVLVAFENGFVCQQRLILLDSFLVFFCALSIWSYSEFFSCRFQPFTSLWYQSLALTGISIGLVVSVKLVGLFTIALIGLATVLELWSLITDPTVKIQTFGRHFGARVAFLIVLPLTVYASFYAAHFAILRKSSSASAFMSPEFQATLYGNEIQDSFREPAYGSTVIFRHEGTSGGYLHSHPHNYPAGSKQQQITCYPFRDENSHMLVKYPLEFQNGSQVDKPITGFDRLKHGSVVRLEHVPTRKRLHGHDVRPGWNDDKEINEVSCYGTGEPDFLGDSNDHWRIEVLGSEGNVDAMTSRIRLKHVNTGCYLMSRESKLPKWGFGQQEVTCSTKAKKSLTIWRIEYTKHPQQPQDSQIVNYKKPNFFQKFIELHRVMFNVNNGLKDSHPFDSRPGSWPLLQRGIAFWTSKTEHKLIYLIGNPIIWLSVFLSVVGYIGYQLVVQVLLQRGISVAVSVQEQVQQSGAFLFAVGWALHYLPFFIMKRQLFIHHYFPALYIGILLTGAMFELFLRFKSLQLVVLAGLTLAVISLFYLYAPITYGFEMSQALCQRLKLRSKWDFDCGKFQ
ncbi:Dolichyl-phosphate-mannose-protein mannosyltransferase-domain-containing protein [Gorgonomyces haynaldii]|nr:Dolichyl-phosphate-mannose-protein mannosyltransferase-domain-containing protein [Gorgonomyces haynaldii]